MQVLSVVTVGNDQDGLSLETALGMETSNFISHFTCPSFAINEVCCHASFHDLRSVSMSDLIVSAKLPTFDADACGVQMKARHGLTKKVEVEGARLLRMALSSEHAMACA